MKLFSILQLVKLAGEFRGSSLTNSAYGEDWEEKRETGANSTVTPLSFELLSKLC